MGQHTSVSTEGLSVLVTDGAERAALAAVRSLGLAGYRVHVCADRKRTLAGASRFAHSTTFLPSALLHPEEFARGVAELVSRDGIRVVLPVSEGSLLALLARPGAVAPAILPFPTLEAFDRVRDKALVLELAGAQGIAVPRQHVLGLPGGSTAEVRFPLVVKPARSVGSAVEGVRGKFGVAYASSQSELRRVLDNLPASAYPLLLQERIVGPGVGIFLLRWNGQRVATFAHRRLREKPPSGGVSVYRESIAADPDLVKRSEALLTNLGWDSVAMIEYKIDRETGVPYLMEINGRLWGSLQLAIDAGVDFPRLLVESALEKSPAHVSTYRLGVRSRWWWGDVDQLLSRLRRSDTALALPPGSPSRTRALLEFLALWRPGDRNEVLRLGDPGPFVRETLDWFRGR